MAPSIMPPSPWLPQLCHLVEPVGHAHALTPLLALTPSQSGVHQTAPRKPGCSHSVAPWLTNFSMEVTVAVPAMRNGP